MLRLLLISGFNPFGLESWGIDKYYVDYCAPKRNNWTIKDIDYVMDYYTAQFEDDNYIISCHSDGGTVAHYIANYDSRCVGLHCHAAVFLKPEIVRDIPILLTNNAFDLTGMGFCSLRAYRFYRAHQKDVEYFRLPRGGSSFNKYFGHNYDNCIPTFRAWCMQNFNLNIEIKE